MTRLSSDGSSHAKLKFEIFVVPCRYEQIRGSQLEGIYFKNVGSVLAGIQGNPVDVL